MNAYETARILAEMAIEGVDGTVDTFITHDDGKEEMPSTGYWVGGIRPSLIFSDKSRVDRGDIAWFVGGTESRYFGSWVDVADGTIHIDASDHVDNREDALYLAAERGEIAVWDIANESEIRVETNQGTEAA